MPVWDGRVGTMNVTAYKTFGKREAAYYSTEQYAKSTPDRYKAARPDKLIHHPQSISTFHFLT
jgi:hypothetical protein